MFLKQYLTKWVFVGSTSITIKYRKFRREFLMLIEILFHIHVLFHAIVFSCNVAVCFVIKYNWNDVFSFLYCNWPVLYILFHLSQLIAVYQFEHIKDLKQFRNVYTTSLTVKTYFETVHDLSPQTALIRYHVSRNTLHCPGIPLISVSF